MKRRPSPDDAPMLPPHLATFTPADWPGRPDDIDAVGTDRQWRRLRWNRARSRHLRSVST